MFEIIKIKCMLWVLIRSALARAESCLGSEIRKESVISY